MNFEQQSYEINDLWIDEIVSEADIERVKVSADLIPPDVKSILDVGCGGGIFVNYLLSSGRHYDRLCGIDRSNSALQHVKTEKKLAEVNQLPFQNNEFHMVTCLEVLEHLSLNIYSSSLNELSRIAKKYILISVPNHENLKKSLVYCPSCCTKFNPDYHMRSYDCRTVKRLFDERGFQCINLRNVCEFYSYRFAQIVNFFTRFSSMSSPWYAICPVCGYRGNLLLDEARDNVAPKQNIFKKSVKKIWPKTVNYRWILALYKRQ
jgi:ubiquinone/menaquinone biosynthesis C-methylase UbiE